MASGFEDLFGALGAKVPPKKPEKGIPWEAKVINDEYYIPLRQVADLLEQNDVLPAVREGIRRRVSKGPSSFVKKAGHETTNDEVREK